MQRAIFLDRDGVIIENRPNYVRSWEDVLVYPQALQALVRISGQPYKIVIVTNQSAVGRQLLDLSTAQSINLRLVEVIQQAGGRIDGIFMCPHAPQENCSCRKPRPGLFLQAAEALSLDLSQSIMIGDAVSDLQAGRAAGVSTNILVLTGRGKEQFPHLAQANLAHIPVYADLFTAFVGLFPPGPFDLTNYKSAQFE